MTLVHGTDSRPELAIVLGSNLEHCLHGRLIPRSGRRAARDTHDFLCSDVITHEIDLIFFHASICGGKHYICHRSIDSTMRPHKATKIRKELPNACVQTSLSSRPRGRTREPSPLGDLDRESNQRVRILLVRMPGKAPQAFDGTGEHVATGTQAHFEKVDRLGPLQFLPRILADQWDDRKIFTNPRVYRIQPSLESSQAGC